MRPALRFALLLLLLFAGMGTGYGQSAYVITHLDNTGGLSNNSIADIFQDSDRLLWISTADGLNVYNGNSFQLFKSYDFDSASGLPDNVILKVREDNKKQIWICTEKGVTSYNKESGDLQHYFFNTHRGKNSGTADYILTISPKGAVVAGLRLDSVLYEYSDAQKSFRPIKFDIPSVGMIAEIGFDDDGRLWTLSIGGGIHVFEKRGAVYYCVKLMGMPSGIHLFFMANHHVFFVDGARELCEIGDNLQPVVKAHLDRLINSIVYFQGHYIVSYVYKGMQEFDGDFKPVENLVKLYPELNSTELGQLLSTGDNILWLSTAERGLFKVVSNKNNFGTMANKPKGGMINTSVTTFAKVNNELWVGTRNDGLIIYKNLDSGTVSNAVINPVSSFYAPPFNYYYTIVKGYDGNYYIGSDAMGVTIYDPRLNKFTPWLSVKGVNFNKDFFRSFSILPCNDSSVYVGYLHGLIHLKVSRDNAGNFSLDYSNEYKNDPRFLNLGNNAIASLTQKGNWILAGYQYAGLVLVDKHTGRSISILKKDHDQSLSSNNITSLYIDSKNYLWIGTDYGLNRIRFDSLFTQEPRFRSFNVENGLPDNMIHGILEDNDHAIWVSTNKGLAKLNPDSFKIIQYRAQDGLQNDEFNDRAVYKDNTGKLYFGGIEGFNHFDPQKIYADNNLPNLLISDLSFGGQTSSGIRLMVIKPDHNNAPKDYDIKRNQNFFHLKIEAANGFANVKFQYKYILKGFDSQWHDVNGNSRIEYSNLPAGDYNFYVKWSNGQGEWTQEKKVFQVTIEPYFWFSSIAKIIYSVLVSAIAYTIYRVRKTRLEFKNKLFVENLIRVKEQKLYQEKVNFFTNITHELQTPLTLILGSIERFNHQSKEAEKKSRNWKFLRIANQEAFRLQYLVHQLLEFRKAESGHARVVLNYFNASNLIKNIAELFGAIKDQKLLNFELDVSENILIYSDKDKFEKIIFNLFSNAFKHSSTGENIKCVVEPLDENELKIIFSNSGFEPGDVDLSFLFEQFYTIDHNKNAKESSGIGLALTKQLTEILGGTINVSTDNQWIVFEVLLPLNKKSNELSEDKLLSDRPSYLVRSIAESMEVAENTVSKNNDEALIENLEAPGKKSVLVVEDDSNIRLLLKEVLQDEFVVYEAENGQNAIELLKKIVPNLILSDVLMSDMDGLSLCTKVKNNMATCHIPFLLLSARNSAEQKLEGFEAGADGYLTKPYNPASLIRKIKELIDYRENIQQVLNKDQYYQTINHNGLKAEDQVFLNQVIKFISENMADTDLDAGQLEKELSLSRMSLYRRLMALTNMTPAEFIRHLRLRQAATLLRTTSLTVSEIYYQTGFNNQSYFYREFKKAYHTSPKEFRENNQIDAVQS